MNNKRKSEKFTTYKTTIYFDVARMYSEKKCKTCYGRGYLKFTTPSGEENHAYCKCALKNIKKYG
tara:strand:+ start:33466 stop:33660 length:195 start_codon:yes stop_codon:yes gene_type:complete